MDGGRKNRKVISRTNLPLPRFVREQKLALSVLCTMSDVTKGQSDSQKRHLWSFGTPGVPVRAIDRLIHFSRTTLFVC